MFYVIFVAFFSTLLAYSSSRGNKFGLEMSFLVITIFLSLRYNFGSDYPAYLSLFNEINSYAIDIFDLESLSNLSAKGETGWVILNKLCAPIGFFGFIILITSIENFLIYKFIKHNVPARFHWLSVFMYTFTSVLILIGACSMLRQWFAATIFLYASTYIIRKKPISYYGLVFCAISIHTSAWVMVPMYALAYLRPLKKMNNLYLFFLLLLFIMWTRYMPLLFKQFLPVLLEFKDMQYYSNYVGGSSIDSKFSLIGLFSFFIQQYFIPFIVLLRLPRMNYQIQVVSLLYLAFLFVIPFESVFPLIGRMKYYFLLFGLAAVPWALRYTQGKYKYLIYIGVAFYMLFTVRELVSLPSQPNWKSFQNYQTIFSAPCWS